MMKLCQSQQDVEAAVTSLQKLAETGRTLVPQRDITGTYNYKYMYAPLCIINIYIYILTYVYIYALSDALTYNICTYGAIHIYIYIYIYK